MLSLKEGTLLVKTARRSIEKFFNKDLEHERTGNKRLNKKHGLFVTIRTFPSNDLRGCIGFISPMPIYRSVQAAAVEAAFNDPRFSPLSKKELEHVTIEISIMTEPMLVPAETMKNNIKIGKDGLIISNANYSGLLLPQVPVEQRWGIEEFLKGICQKAGMPFELLKDENTKLWKFQCQVFCECEPMGDVKEVKLC
jgi:uncharacterized protein (TIGR00296 family)